MMAKIIAYRTLRDIDVEFEDHTICEHFWLNKKNRGGHDQPYVWVCIEIPIVHRKVLHPRTRLMCGSFLYSS